MKKNGFTLIEVIGTMVILSLILLMVYPVIKDAFNASKGELSEEQMASLENVARIWATKNSDELSEEQPKYLTIEELKRSGLVENKDILKMNSDEELTGCIKIYYENNKYNYEYLESENCNFGNYQLVEYIENTGTQYIDTGLKANSNTKVEIKILGFTAVTGKTYMFGARNGISTNTNGFALFSNANNTDFQFGAGRSMPTTTLTQNSVIVADKTGLTINGVATQLSTNIRAFNPNYNMIIGGVMSGGTVQYGSGQKFVYIKIYDNDTLIRHFIPCYRKSDNVIGMYDSVNGEFYENAGTGVFVKGQDA